MIIGAHSILYSTDPDADRAFLRDALGFPHVDAGEGWLIFGLPPAEVAVHPGEENDVHELYLMTDDVEALVETLAERGIATAEIADQGWGRLTSVTLPGGGKLGVYEARHERPPQHEPGKARNLKSKARKAAPARAGKARAQKTAARKTAARAAKAAARKAAGRGARKPARRR